MLKGNRFCVKLYTSYLTDPCSNSSCQNDGKCLRDGLGGHECNCTSTGYNGEYCQIAGIYFL